MMNKEQSTQSHRGKIHVLKIKEYTVFTIFLAVFTFATYATSAQNDKRTAYFNLDNKLAIQGYDPVSYFIKNKAEKGNKNFSYSFEGITYYFSSASNRVLFTKAPEKFEPQYGGWCAYAMGAKGEKVEVDPETFKVLDGKLYLFYHTFLNNTLTNWNADEKNLKIKADTNWKKIVN